MSRASEFINRYKVLEDLLEAKYRDEGRPTSNTVYQFVCDKESAPFRERLDLCRQVRNLLTHSADINGESPVEPSESLLQTLNAVIDYLTQPPLALPCATPVDKLLKASPDDRILWLMRRMTERGYSHVPVLKGSTLEGVFSVSTLFSMALDGKVGLRQDSRIRDIMPTLRLEAHKTERFLFIPADCTVNSARDMFARKIPRETRVAALFVTENGSPSAPLRGMLTPWDLME